VKCQKRQVLDESGIGSGRNFIVVHGLDIMIERLFGFLNIFQSFFNCYACTDGWIGTNADDEQ
jgi:hypothetical protein